MSNRPSLMQAFSQRLLESQYWPLERMRAEQAKYLRELLLHARTYVPFYRNRFEGVLGRDGELDWTGWNNVPILTRSEALANLDALRALEIPQHQGTIQSSVTSGSTGPALRVLDSALALTYHAAAVQRAYGWHRMDPRRDMVLWYGEDPDVARAPHGVERGVWGAPWDSRSTGKRIVLNRYAATADVLRLLAEHPGGYFSARPAAAHAAALEAERLGLDIRLDGVCTFSTGVRPDEREDFLRIFGARTIEPYSAKEGHFIAQQCPSGTHFHINEEIVYVEIVDDAGRPCAVGETGRVLVTLLYNYPQPLIRYELGDLARVGPPCSCGRTLRVIDHIAGRVTHMFRLPDGKRTALSLSIDVQRAFGAQYWQIAQVAPLMIEVRYVPSGERSGDEHVVADIIRQKTHPMMQVKFSRRSDLHRPDGRKFIEYVCELDAT